MQSVILGLVKDQMEEADDSQNLTLTLLLILILALILTLTLTELRAFGKALWEKVDNVQLGLGLRLGLGLGLCLRQGTGGESR